MSKKKKKQVQLSPEQYMAAAQYIRQFEDRNNHLMESTAQILLPLISYCMQKLEVMKERLDEDNANTPFSMKLRNRGGRALAACNEFIETFEGLLIEGGMKAFGLLTDSLFPSLDNYFKTIEFHQDANPTSQVSRRAKLRYHDPYPEHVKECTAAFEDGYEKGYCDCVRDIHIELAKLKDAGDAKAIINIAKGMVEITKAE